MQCRASRVMRSATEAAVAMVAEKCGAEARLGDSEIRSLLTVLFPRFLTLQFKYAVFPSSAVTFLEAILSKYGPILNASKSSAFLPNASALLSFESFESRCDAETETI